MQNLNSNHKVGFYEKGIKQTTNPKIITIYDFFATIQQERYTAQIQAIRSEIAQETPNEKHIAELKKTLPYITTSGIFKTRNTTEIVSHSGLLQVDIDKLAPNAKQALKEALQKDSFILAIFESPTGRGLKAVMQIPTTPETHKNSFFAVAEYFLQKYQTTIDYQCQDISRAMYVSSDKGIFVNTQSQLFTAQAEPPAEPIKNNATAYSTQTHQEKEAEVLRIIDLIAYTHTDITQGQKNWAKLAFSFAEFWGEQGRQYFHIISQKHPTYNEKECNDLYSYCLKNNNHSTSIASFFQYAKQNGIDISLPKAKITQAKHTQTPQPEAQTPAQDNDKQERAEKRKKYLKEHYLRIGDSYYEIFWKPNKEGKLEKTFVTRSKTTITDDYGKNSIKAVPKYKAFCLVPSHTDYQQVIGYCYNKYHELAHKPKESADTPINSLNMIKHVFGEDRIELGLDYLQLLYTQPTQLLPILCIVSKDRNTGKSTFAQWLIEIFGENAIKLGNADFESQFNAPYAEKLLITVDETSIDKSVISEAIKRLSTEKGKILVNQKNMPQYETEFIGKFIFISNQEENFLKIEKGENRYLVLKIPALPTQDNQDFDKVLKAEIPAFLSFLAKRKLYHKRESRMFFNFELLKSEQLNKVIKASQTRLEKEIRQQMKETFEVYETIAEFGFTAQDLLEELKESIKDLTKTRLIEILENELNLTKKTGRFRFYSLKEHYRNPATILPKKEGNTTHYLVKVQDFVQKQENENSNNLDKGYPKEWDM